MSEPDISPLAKRLAEENNVDWRGLDGSGDNGRIVERDVLEYLARVMAGEEDLNPTPEPLPEGMDAWPEEDVRATSAVAEAATAPLEAEAEAEDAMMLEDDLLFEDVPSEVAPETAPPPPPASAQSERSIYETEINEDIFLLEDDLASQATELESAPTAEAFAEDALDDLSIDTVPESALANEAQSEEVFVSDEFIDDKDDTLWDQSDPSTLAASSDTEAPELFGDQEVPADAGSDVFATDTGSAEIVEAVMTDSTSAESEIEDQAGAELLEPDLATTKAAATPEVDLDDLEDADEVLPAALDVSQLPIVSHGVLLRRHVDLTALADAQLAVGRELGDEHPVAPTGFLVRAAAKAYRSVMSAEDGVALALISETGVGAAGFANADKSAFRDLLEQVAELEGSDRQDRDDAGLIIADMSAYDIDEAVLNLGVPVLTLGRILYDNTEGRYQSILSLSGDISAEAGARLLERVAALLAAPVQLVL